MRPRHKIAILLNRRNSRLSTLSKKLLQAGYRLAHGEFEPPGELILPEYDSFARILDPAPVVLGTGDGWTEDQIRDCGWLIWEWGWTETPARTVLEIRERVPISLLMFPGQLDRFWRELDYRSHAAQSRAVAITDAIGVMLDDTRAFYQSLAPSAHVFHMPVPLAVDYYSALAEPPENKDKTRLLLTAPTRFTGKSGQMHIATYLVFRELSRRKPRLEGLCFVYTREEQAECETMLRDLGLSRHVEIQPYLRPITRYVRKISGCYLGLCPAQGLVQGRTAMLTACLGIPMVVGDEVETHRFLYPETCVKWYDTAGAARLCEDLMENPDFHARVRQEARRQVSYYDIDRCRQRMLEGMAAASRRKTVPLEASEEPFAARPSRCR